MWTVFSMDDLTNRWQSLLLTEEKEAKVDLMKEKKNLMFQREPRKWRTQELRLAQLFQPMLVKMRLNSKALYPFYPNFPQVSL